MLTQILTIARTTFVESVRQPIYFIIIVLCGLFQLVNTSSIGYSLAYSDTAEVSGDNKLLLDVGLATILFCGTLLAGFIATAALSREIENRTVLTVVSKPVPRPVVVLGKYAGIAAALTLGAVTMVIFLQLGLRHGVLSTARDETDWPVLGFSLIAMGVALAVALWCNFFYGWHFTQTASLMMCPLFFLAWVFVLLISKKWEWQPLLTNFKPQVFLASVLLIFALLVLAAVATAASARLGQVMTIIVCFGVFVLGLMSNYLLGRNAHQNTALGQLIEAKPERDRFEAFTAKGDTYFLTLRTPPTSAINPGDPLYYGPNPNGFDLATPAFDRFAGTLADPDTFFAPTTPPALVVTAIDGRRITLRNLGRDAVRIDRPPEPGDFVFLKPTKATPISTAYRVAWGVIPNTQFFWLTDAVTQNRVVPPGHVGLVILYSGAQITAFLSLAVLLFQRREVG